MRLGVLAIFSVLWIASSSVMSLNSVRQASLQVNCPESTGCFGLIRKALGSASAGSTIHLGPGVFYEQPLVIDKSLTLQGAGLGHTKIRMVEPGSAIAIRSMEPLDVVIASLTIAVPFVWDKDGYDSIGITWVQEADTIQTIVIKDSEITSAVGVGISSRRGSLTVQQSHLQSIATGIGIRTRGEITVAIEGSSLDGPFTYGIPDLSSLVISSAISFKPDDSPGRVLISLKNNQIQFWHFGFGAISAGHEGWSRAEALLVGNMITYNKAIGISLAGDTDAELIENTISNNDGYGVLLALPPCVTSLSPNDVVAFRGQVRGKDNVIIDNKKADLCPPDYPWPPGFRK